MAYQARPRGNKCRPKSHRLHSLFPLPLCARASVASLTFSGGFLPLFPSSLFFSFPLLLCLPLHPSILCPRHYRGSWLNCLEHGNRQLGSAAVCAAGRRRFIVSIAARVHRSSGRARLAAFLPSVSFSAAQHKRSLLQEAEQDAKKNLGM